MDRGKNSFGLEALEQRVLLSAEGPALVHAAEAAHNLAAIEEVLEVRPEGETMLDLSRQDSTFSLFEGVFGDDLPESATESLESEPAISEGDSKTESRIKPLAAGGSLDFNVGGFLNVHVGSYSQFENPGAGDPYANGQNATLTFTKMPEFPTLALGSISLFKAGDAIDGFSMSGLHLPFSGAFTLPGQEIVRFQNPALDIANFSLKNGVVSGALTLSAEKGVILPNATGFTAELLDGGNGGAALSGDFDLADGDIALTAEKLAFAIPGVLEAAATGAIITFSPNAAATQKLFEVGQANVTLSALGNIATTVNGFQIRGNGFSFDDASIVLGDFTLGGFLTAHTPTLRLEGMSYTLGGPLLGSWGLGALGADIRLPGGLTASILDGIDPLDFAIDGSFSLADKTFHLNADMVDLAIPGLLDLSASSLAINYNPFGSFNQELFSFGSINVGLLPLNVEVPVVGLHIRLDGFSLDDQLLPDVPSVNLGSFLNLSSPDLGLRGINFALGAPLLGTIDLDCPTGSITLGNGFSAAITDGLDALDLAVDGSFDLQTGKFSLQMDQLSLSAPSLFSADFSGATLAFDPAGPADQLLMSIGQLTAQILPLGVSTQLSDLRVKGNGFTLGNISTTIPNVTLGDFLTIETPTLTMGGVGYTIGGSPAVGTLGLSASSASLTIGTGLTGTISDGTDALEAGIAGSYNVTTRVFDLAIDQLALQSPNLFTATGSAVQLHFDPAGTISQEIFAAGSLNVTLIALGSVTGVIDGLRVRGNGFSFNDASIGLGDFTLGGFLTVHTPTVRFQGVSYTIGAPLLGSWGLGALGADVTLPGGLTASILDGIDPLDFAIDGSFSLADKTFNLNADLLDLAIPGLLDLSASALAINYNPFGSFNQELFSFGSINVGLLPLNVEVPVVGLHIRLDGFSLDDQLLPDVPTVNLGSFLNLPSPDLGLRGINFALGAPLLGTIDLDCPTGSITLGSGFSATITDGLDALDLAVDGSFDLQTGKFSLQLDQLALSAPSLFSADFSGATLAFDPAGPADQLLLSIGQLTAQILPLGVTTQLSDLRVKGNGFTLGNSSTLIPNVTLGDFLTIETPTLTVGGVGYTIGGSPAIGTLGLSAPSASLTIGTGLTGTITDGTDDLAVAIAGSFNVTTQVFDLAVDQLALQSPNLFTASGSAVQLHFDPAGSVDQEVFAAGRLNATLTALGTATATIDGLRVRKNGFSIANGSVTLPNVTVGTMFSMTSPTLTFTDVSYTTGQPFSGRFGLSAQTAALFPGRAYTAEVTDGSDAGSVGIEGSYDIVSKKFHLSVDQFNLQIPKLLTATASGVTVDYDPAGGDSQVVATIASATLNFPALGVEGTIQNLTVRPNGLQFGSASIARTGEYVVGSVKLTDIGIQLTNFGIDYSTGATFNGSITVFTTKAAVQAGSTVTANVSDGEDADTIGLGATFDLSNGNFGGLTFTADVLDVTFGSFLKLTGRSIAIFTNVGLGDIVLQVGSVSAQLTTLGLTGTGGGFAIRANGSLVTLPGFGFSFPNLGSLQLGSLKWPDWLPIKLTSLALQWPDFSFDPGDFRIIFSATALQLPDMDSLTFSGSLNGVVLDVGRLKLGKFPIIGLGSISVSVSGRLFGGTISGGFSLGLLRLDELGRLIPSGNLTTPVFDTVLYGRIDAGFNFAGLRGFSVQLGLSALGPLQVYVRADVPVLLEATTGLTVSGFRGGVSFNNPLPAITDPLDLRNPTFTPPLELTADQWLSQLEAQVLSQYKTGSGTATWTNLTAGLRIMAGATLYSSHTSQEVFRADIDIALSTNGRFLISGTATFANNLRVGAKFYADLSQSNPKVFFLVDLPPSPNQTLTIRGQLQMGVSGGTFYLRLLNGGVDIAPNGLTAITVSGSVTLTFSSTRFTLDLDGTVNISPLGDALKVAGRLVIEKGSVSNPNSAASVWGVLRVVPNFSGLGDLGLTVENAEAVFQLNTNSTDKTESIALPGEQAKSYVLKARSYRVTVVGDMSMKTGDTDLFEMSGMFDMEIAGSGQLSVFAEGTVAIGPPGMRFLNFDFTGFFQVNKQGTAGKIDIDLASNYAPSSKFNLGFDGALSFYMMWNTTREEVRYVLPDDQRIVVPSSPIGPGQQGTRGEKYLQVIAEGKMSVGPVAIDGSFFLLVTASGIDLRASGTIDLAVPGPNNSLVNLLSFNVSGALRIDPSGISAVLILDRTGEMPENAGFSFSSSTSFRLEVNTTKAQQTVVVGPTNYTLEAASPYVRIQIQGSLEVQNLEIVGLISLTVGTDVLNLQADAKLTLRAGSVVFLTLNVTGGLQWDHRGLAASVHLSLNGSLPNRDGYQLGSLTDGSMKLEINTTNRAVTIGSVTLAKGIYGRVSISAKLTLGGMFKLDGTFKITAGVNLLTISADAALNLAVDGVTLLKFAVAGTLELQEKGIIAAIGLTIPDGGGLPSEIGVSLSLSFRLEINSTGTSRTVALGGNSLTLAPNTYRVFGSGSVQVGSFKLSGEFYLSVSSTWVKASADATLSLYGLTLNVAGDLLFYSDGMAASIDIGTQVLDTDYFKLDGQLSLKFNTAKSGSNRLGIAPNTYLVSVSGASLTIAGVTLSGSLTIGYINGAVALTIPSDDPLTLKLLDIFTVQFSGTIRNSTFSLTGSAEVTLGKTTLVAIKGTLSVTLKNTGVTASLNARAWLLGADVANADGTLTINTAKKTYSVDIAISFGFTLEGALYLSGSATVLVRNTGVSVSFSAQGKLFGNSKLSFNVYGSIDTASGHYYLHGGFSFFAGDKALGVEVGASLEIANYSGSNTIVIPGWATFENPFSSGFKVSLYGTVWVLGFRALDISASGNSSGKFSISVNILGIFEGTVHLDLNNGFNVWKSDIAGATVFLDLNGNGVLDVNEPSTLMDENGTFNFTDTSESGSSTLLSLKVLSRYDTNRNGLLDALEGQLVLVGGSYRETGDPLQGSLILPGTTLGQLAPVGNGEIFFDANKNGVKDSKEVSTRVDANGFYSFPEEDAVSRLGLLAAYDLNGNGLLDAAEGQLRVQGGIITDPETGQTSPGDQALDNALLAGFTPANGATRVFFDADKNGVYDTGEASLTPDSEDFYSFDGRARLNDLGRLKPFDKNGNGAIDPSEGQFVIVGGTDKNTGLLETGSTVMPASNYGQGLAKSATPYTPVLEALRRSGLNDRAANRAALVAFGLPVGVQLDYYSPRAQSGANESLNQTILRGASQMNILMIAGSALFGPNVTTAAAERALAESLASVIRGLNKPEPVKDAKGNSVYPAQLDLSNATVVRQVLNGAATRLPVAPSEGSMNTASRIIAGLVRAANTIADSNLSTDLVTALGAVKGLAATDASDTIRAVINGTLTPAIAIAKYSDQGILVNLSTRRLPPFIKAIGTQEGTGQIVVPVRVENPNGLTGNLTVRLTSDNPELLPSGILSITGSGADRSLTITPVPGLEGRATITVEAEYSSGSVALKSAVSFKVRIRNTNLAPTVSAISTQKLEANQSTGAIPFAIADADTALGNLAVTARSLNPDLIGPAGIQLAGSGASRTIAITPKTNQSGVAVVLVEVSDGANTTVMPVLVQVRDARLAPTASFVANPAVFDSSASLPLAFQVAQATRARLMDARLSDPDTLADTLTVRFVSDNPSIIGASAFSVTGSGADRSVVFNPPPGVSGTAKVDLIVSDGLNTSKTTFQIKIVPVNQAPSIARIIDQEVNSGAEIRVPIVLADADTPATGLILSFETSNAQALPLANVKVEGSGLERVLVLKGGSAFGLALLTVQVSDGSSQSRRVLGVSVEDPVGAPSVSDISDAVMGMNESSPLIRFVIGSPSVAANQLQVAFASSNPALVPVSGLALQGAGADRALLVTPAAGQTGTATITMSVSDGIHKTVKTFQVKVEERAFNVTAWTAPVRQASGALVAEMLIADDGHYVEARAAGLSEMWVKFSAAVDAGTFDPGNVVVTGVRADGNALDLSGIGLSTRLLDNGRTGVIQFNQALPDQAVYRLSLAGVRGVTGANLSGDQDRVVAILAGDINGDKVVNSQDVGLLRSLRSSGSVNVASTPQLRADLNGDGRVTNADLAGLNRLLGRRVDSVAAPLSVGSLIASGNAGAIWTALGANTAGALGLQPLAKLDIHPWTQDLLEEFLRHEFVFEGVDAFATE